MDYNTKEFKKLKEKWYSKLQKSDFKDIEQDENNLKIWESYFFKNTYNKVTFEAKQAYYRMASQFLIDYKFANRKEFVAWQLHVEGKNNLEIGRILKKRRFKIGRDAVYKILNRLSKTMLDMHKENNRIESNV